MRDLGMVKPGTTLYLSFNTFDSNDPTASVTMSGLATTDIEIYKDGSVTQRSSDSGYTLLDTDGTDFDGITGVHGISIDLSDNSDAGFYEAGSKYWIVISSVTVDAGTISFTLAEFTIGYDKAILNTTIATLASQTSFTLEEGSVDNDAYNGCSVIVHDVASAVQVAIGYVLDYTGASKTVTLAVDPGIFTMAAGDNISFFMPANIMAINGTAQTANDNGADINAILTDTNEIQGKLPTNNIMGSSDTDNHDTDIDAILVDTNELQTDWTNGGRLDLILDDIKAVTDVLNNLSSADIQTIIENNNLDHLCKIATAAADMTAEVVDNSILSRILANGDTSAFDPSTDGLQPIRDRGDTAWITGAGGDATAANQTTIINSLTAAKGATFDTATDSLEAIRNRGDAAWTSGSLSGANTVTITVNDGDGNPIIDVDVQIWNNAVDAFLTKDRSDSNGQFIFTADDNTYKVKLKKAGYTFNSTETLVVSGDTSDTYTGTSNESTTPASSDVCRVYEYIRDPDGNYPAEVNAIVNITTLPHDDGSSLYSGEKYDGVYDPNTGKVYWDVIKGAAATFKIINYGINLNVTVPSNVDTVRLTDI